VERVGKAFVGSLAGLGVDADMVLLTASTLPLQ
jgi:hypothetical protein